MKDGKVYLTIDTPRTLSHAAKGGHEAERFGLHLVVAFSLCEAT
jgi:hypothetical protein